jgi:hypothetical protein
MKSRTILVAVLFVTVLTVCTTHSETAARMGPDSRRGYRLGRRAASP